MRPGTKPVIVRSATAWSQRDATEATLLQHRGFAGGVAEEMVTPGNADRYGLSLVVQLSSAANARVALKYDYTSDGPWTRFAVPGIPGAVGFERIISGQGGRNVGFTVGPYAYLVAAGWEDGGRNAVARSALIAAARLVYERVR